MIRLELTFINNPYRIEINCKANQLTGFYMTQVFMERCFRTNYIVNLFPSYYTQSKRNALKSCYTLTTWGLFSKEPKTKWNKNKSKLKAMFHARYQILSKLDQNKYKKCLSKGDFPSAVQMFFLTPSKNMFAGKFVKWVRLLHALRDYIFYSVEWVEVRKMSEAFEERLSFWSTIVADVFTQPLPHHKKSFLQRRYSTCANSFHDLPKAIHSFPNKYRLWKH